MTCDRCGASTVAAVCPSCGAAMPYAAPKAKTETSWQPALSTNVPLRVAATLQIGFVILMALGGLAVYVQHTRIGGTPVTYTILAIYSGVMLVASIQLRRGERWAWLVSIVMASLMLLLLAVRIALGQIRVGQSFLVWGMFLADLILLITGRPRTSNSPTSSSTNAPG